MYRKPKNEEDVRYILNHLRKHDIEELKAIHGEDFIEKVFAQIMETDFEVLLGATKDGDIPVCMGGAWHLDKDPEGSAVVWLLCTDEIVNHKHCLLRELKKEFDKYNKKYWFLYNFIYSKNTLAKLWLRKFGFNFVKPVNINIPKGFELFYRIRKCKGLLED